MKLTSNIRPPQPGEQNFFVCRNCGHRFRATVKFFGPPQKCPKCGSLNVGPDPAIVH